MIGMPDGAELAMPWVVLFPARAARPARPRLWQRLLSPGWRHVFACRMAGPDATLVVEHVGSHLLQSVQPEPIGVLVVQWQDQLHAMVLLVPPLPARPGAALRPPMTCVEAVKAALGIRAWWVLTPRALFRHLRRLGAQVVLPATS